MNNDNNLQNNEPAWSIYHIYMNKSALKRVLFGQ